MDLNPLDPKVAPASTVGARRHGGSEGGFRGVMELMAHLAARGPSHADDARRPPPEASRPPVERARPVSRDRSEPAEDDRTQASRQTRRERQRVNAGDEVAPSPVAPSPVAPSPAAPSPEPSQAPAAPPQADAAVPAPTRQAAGPDPDSAPAIPASTETPTLLGVPATPAPDAAAVPDATAPDDLPVTPAPAHAAAVATAGADQAAAAPALPAPAPVPQTAAAKAPIPQTHAHQAAPIGPAAPAQVAQAQVAQAQVVQAPAAQSPAEQAPAEQGPAEQARSATPQAPAGPRPTAAAAPGAAVAPGGEAKSGSVPREVKVSVEPAPVVARSQGVSSAVLVQAHMAAAGDAAGKPGGLAGQPATGQPATAQAATGQAAPAQPGTTLHVGGGQALHVGADSGNTQTGNTQAGDGNQPGGQNGGGQNGGGQNGGGQPNGGQAQAGAGFAFGSATIGQRGFGGDAARSQFQEILSTRTARAPLQGPGGMSSATPSSLSFTAGPGGPQSTLPTAMASRAAATAQGRPGALPSTAVGQVAVKLAGSAADGGGRVTIRLNPEELGKVDVKLELGRDGLVRAMISAERPETLDMLQRDARLLEKALQEAGLKTDQNSLEFDLRGGNGQPADRDDAQPAVADGPTTTDDDGAGEAVDTASASDAGGVRADGSYDLVA